MATSLILSGLLAQLLVSLALVAGVLLARGRTAAVRSHVWRAGLVAFALAPLAPLLTETLGLPTLALRLPAAALAPGPGEVGGGTGLPARIPREISAEVSSVGATAPAPVRSEADVREPRPDWRPWAVGLWGAGALLLAAALAREALLLARLVGRLAPTPDPALRATVDRWCRHLGLRRAPVFATSPDIAAPAAMGWPLWVVLFPDEPGLDLAHSDGVAVHELAHVRRADSVVVGLALLVRAVWWWNPVAWWIARGVRDAAEEACDDWAIAVTGDRRRYAESLSAFARRRGVVTGIGAAARGMTLLRRVERIVRMDGAAVAPALAGRHRALVAGATLLCLALATTLRVGAGAPRGGWASLHGGTPTTPHQHPPAPWDEPFGGGRARSKAAQVRLQETEPGKPVLAAVWIHGEAYGWTGPRDLVLAVTDEDLNPLAVFPVPYAVFPYMRDAEWTRIPVPEEVRPPARFGLAVYSHSVVDSGVYISLGRCGPSALSSLEVGIDAESRPSPTIEGEPGNWGIRAEMAEVFVGAPDGPCPLRRDAGLVSGQTWIGGLAHTVRFETPGGGERQLAHVLLRGRYFGLGETVGRENRLVVRVLDSELRELGEWYFRYDELYRSEATAWTSLPLEQCPTVRGTFYVAVDTRTRDDNGVNIAYDGSVPGGNSFLLSVNGLEPWSPKEGAGEWCIRCELAGTAP